MQDILSPNHDFRECQQGKFPMLIKQFTHPVGGIDIIYSHRLESYCKWTGRASRITDINLFILKLFYANVYARAMLQSVIYNIAICSASYILLYFKADTRVEYHSGIVLCISEFEVAARTSVLLIHACPVRQNIK